MMKNSTRSEDYISLTGIVRGCFRIVSLIVHALKRHYYLIAAGIVLGGIAGWLYPLLKGSYYQKTIIVEHRILDKSVYMNIVDGLNQMIVTGSSKRLAGELGIPEDLAAQMISVSTENLHGNPLTNDMEPPNLLFKIVYKLRTPAGADSLDEAILTYINKLPFVRAEMGERLRISQERLVFIRRESDKLDSLKSDYARWLAASRPGVLYMNSTVDPVSIYRQSYILDSVGAVVRENLVQGEKALVEISSFGAGNPHPKSTWFYVLALVSAGFVTAWGIAILLEIKHKIDVDQRTGSR